MDWQKLLSEVGPAVGGMVAMGYYIAKLLIPRILAQHDLDREAWREELAADRAAFREAIAALTAAFQSRVCWWQQAQQAPQGDKAA